MQKRYKEHSQGTHGALHGYFLYLVRAPPEKPTRRCEPEEGYLRCEGQKQH